LLWVSLEPSTQFRPARGGDSDDGDITGGTMQIFGSFGSVSSCFLVLTSVPKSLACLDSTWNG
jgi:hypothetical protein